MMMFDPLLAVSLGFLLSFGSVAGIVVFGRYIQQWLTCLVPVRLRHRSKTLTNGLAIALVAATATLPLTLEAFGILPLIGPLANLFLAPALCLLLVLSLVAHTFLVVLPPVGLLLLTICLYYAGLLASIIKSLAQISWASIPLAGLSTLGLFLFVVSIILLWLWWPRPKRQTLLRILMMTLCCALALGGYSQISSSIYSTRINKTIIVLDVGQGDALLVQDGGQTILVDTGPSPALLRERLLENKVRTIDVLVLTHDHADHARGAQALGPSYKIKSIIVAEGAQSSAIIQDIAQRTAAPVQGVLAGDVISMKNIEVRFIWPLVPVKDPGANESCLIKLIVDISDDDVDDNPLDIMLNSGDAEAPEIKRALNQPKSQDALMLNGKQQAIDILKVPHHGSKSALDSALGQMLAEDSAKKSLGEGSGTKGETGTGAESNTPIAIISSGAGNMYGHPRPETLEIIDVYFQKLYRTDLDGSVTIEL